MPMYRVVWEIDLEASGPEDAARQALEIQRDEDSTATCFGVVGPDGKEVAVDLAQIDEPKIENLVAALESHEIKYGHEVQFAVDDLIYDHVGTDRHASAINNQGYDGQVRALVGRLGIDETEVLIAQIVMRDFNVKD